MRPCTASLMSFGSLSLRILSAKRTRAYSAVWSKPGITVASNTRNSRVFWSSSAISLWRGRKPVRKTRCQSAYCTSKVCKEARRASVSLSLFVARAHARISSSVGVWRPFSSLETLEGGHDNDSASCLPLNPARTRSSRSRLPNALRASRTFDTSDALLCGKVAPFNSVVRSGIAPVIMLHNLG